MEDKGKGNLGRTVWDVLYDFLTEIFAMLIPGGFFVSYFAFAVFLGITCLDNELSESTKIITSSIMGILGLMIVAISYCFGAIFQRREIKRTDQNSARHIYRKREHNNGNSFAFANALDEEYVKRICYILKYHICKDAFVNDIKNFDQKLNKGQLKEKLEENISETLKKSGDTDVLKEKIKFYPELKDIKDSEIDELIKDINDNKDSFMQVLAHTVCSKLLAENNGTPGIARTNSRKFKLLLAYLDGETKRTLKKKLENTVRVHIDAVLDDDFNNLKKEEKYEALIESLEKLKKFEKLEKAKDCRKSLLKTNQRYKALKNFLKQTKPIETKFEGEGELEDILQKVRKLIDGDLNGEIECPYKRMYQYCYDRGLEFARFVDWGDGIAAHDDYVYVIDTLGLTTDESIEAECNRSKIRLNTDKLQISLNNPQLARTLEKNEAHIRFSNSIYYASKLLMKVIAVTTILISLIIAISTSICKGTVISFIDTLAIISETNLMLYLLGLNLVYFAASFYIRYSTRETMNYQRVREVTMFLKAKSLEAEKKE